MRNSSKRAHLSPGERVLLATGDTRRVIQTVPRPGPATVYNLEVHGQHVYHVASTGVLVHNSCGTGFRVMSRAEYNLAKLGKWSDGYLVKGDIAEEGSKWFWASKKAAEKWLKFLQKKR